MDGRRAGAEMPAVCEERLESREEGAQENRSLAPGSLSGIACLSHTITKSISITLISVGMEGNGGNSDTSTDGRSEAHRQSCPSSLHARIVGNLQ